MDTVITVAEALGKKSSLHVILRLKCKNYTEFGF